VVGDSQVRRQGTYTDLLRDPVAARSITELEEQEKKQEEGEDDGEGQGHPPGNGNGSQINNKKFLRIKKILNKYIPNKQYIMN
jgi:hypothetical protein